MRDEQHDGEGPATGRALFLGKALLVAGLAGCGPDAPEPARPPDVLLLTVDTLRPDHLGLYGYGRPTSPQIDRWFTDATLWRRAYATEAATAPSVVSILTGRLPQDHRVRNFYQLLPDEVPTLADRLGAAGYQTAAVVSNVVLTDEAVGLGARFDHYDDFVDEREGERLVFERKAERTTEAALAWLRAERDPRRPHFLWVHYIDPHGPYRAPAGSPQTFAHEGRIPSQPDRMLRYQIDPDVTDALDYVDRYDEEIAYTDREIGRLLAAYAELGLADDAVLAFTADHGETMAEREWWFTHQYHVHEPIARVPLLLRYPGCAAEVIERPVSLVDLAPTLLDLCGVALDDAEAQRSLVAHDPLAEPAPVFVEATSFDERGQRRAMIVGSTKWIVQLGRPGGELQARWVHALELDPDEAERTAWGPLDERRAAALARLIEADPDPGGAPVTPLSGSALDAPKIRPGLDAEQLEGLRQLGYVR